MPPTKTPGDGDERADTPSASGRSSDAHAPEAIDVGDLMSGGSTPENSRDVPALLDAAEDAVHHQEFDHAIEAYALAASPEARQNLVSIGGYLLATGDVATALRAYTTANAQPPKGLLSVVAQYQLQYGHARAAYLASVTAGQPLTFLTLHEHTMRALSRAMDAQDATLYERIAELEFLARQFPQHAAESRAACINIATRARSTIGPHSRIIFLSSAYRAANAATLAYFPRPAAPVQAESDKVVTASDAWRLIWSGSDDSTRAFAATDALPTDHQRIQVMELLLDRIAATDNPDHVSHAAISMVATRYQGILPPESLLRTGDLYWCDKRYSEAEGHYLAALRRFSPEERQKWIEILSSQFDATPYFPAETTGSPS